MKKRLINHEGQKTSEKCRRFQLAVAENYNYLVGGGSTMFRLFVAFTICLLVEMI